MALFDLPRPDFLSQGEKARLIPSVADTSRECRITSILLATMMSVEEFGKGILGSLGMRVGKTSKIQCFTEVVFKGDTSSKIRPDGLITVKTGNKSWSAIVESKIGKAELNKEQVEAYLDIAKQHNIDAVITISNISVADPIHHPLQFGKVKTRNVGLYHWSWMHLITEAIMWTNHYGVSDSDQGYILSEFVRYLQHPSSGVGSFDRMNSEWKDVCTTSLNPPGNANVPVEAFEKAIEAVEKKLGLDNQPHIVVFHEKAGRRHAHCVWSRIDAEKMKAISMSH